jgi:hypothetical protein
MSVYDGSRAHANERARFDSCLRYSRLTQWRMTNPYGNNVIISKREIGCDDGRWMEGVRIVALVLLVLYFRDLQPQ